MDKENEKNEENKESMDEENKMLLGKARLYLALRGEKITNDVFRRVLCNNVCLIKKAGLFQCEKYDYLRLWTNEDASECSLGYWGKMDDYGCGYCIEWAKYLWKGEEGENG